jgi:hypothetical protein
LKKRIATELSAKIIFAKFLYNSELPNTQVSFEMRKISMRINEKLEKAWIFNFKFLID